MAFSKIKTLSSLLTFALLTLGLSQSASASVHKIKFMTYNVENLFDTEHDAGKDDWAYLPLSLKRNMPEHRSACQKVTNDFWRDECFNLDWSANTLKQKIANISAVINSSFDGQGPDILVLQEVENIKALRELQKTGLKGKGYKEVILLEGLDKRGIDVAIISRLPLVATRAHDVVLYNKKPQTLTTRNILEATFKVGEKHLTVFANHWPSQGNPTENRIAAAQTLSNAANEAEARGEIVLALGDFNSLHTEINGAVGEVLETSFIDAVKHRLKNVDTETQKPGTHWYRGSWDFLDRIFIGRNAQELGLEVNWPSLDVHAPEFALRLNVFRHKNGTVERTMIPNRFDAKQKTGYTDHLPLLVEAYL